MAAKPVWVADEAIGVLTIDYVDGDGQFHEGVRLRDVLASIDRTTHAVVCINSHADADVPRLCKLLTRTSLEEHVKRSFRAERESRRKRRETSPQSVLKEVEFSWAISEHDLEHRMRKVSEFMLKGFRVAVSLGTKRGMAKQPLGTMVELLGRIRETCAQWGKECRTEGTVGMRYTILFEGRRPPTGDGDGGDEGGEDPAMDEAGEDGGEEDQAVDEAGEGRREEEEGPRDNEGKEEEEKPRDSEEERANDGWTEKLNPSS